MARSPTATLQANAPFWTMIAIAALYLPVALVAETLIAPSAVGSNNVLGQVGNVEGSTATALATGAVWLLIAGGFLVAFRAELDAMRRRTPWRPPEKGYLILAAGALAAHPLTGLPFVFLVVAGYTLHRGLRVG